jgi:hypothetical protein
MSKAERPILSRRGFLMLTTVGSALAAVVGIELVRRERALPVNASVDAAGLRTIVTFMATLFAHDLSTEDTDDLLQRLAESMQQESERGRLYAVLARHLDDAARARAAADFVNANREQRYAILDDVMRIQPASIRSRALAKLSPVSRDYYQMRSRTVPSLAWLYRNSSVPWKARGYRRWPGVPGDWHEILRPGDASA